VLFSACNHANLRPIGPDDNRRTARAVSSRNPRHRPQGEEAKRQVHHKKGPAEKGAAEWRVGESFGRTRTDGASQSALPKENQSQLPRHRRFFTQNYSQNPCIGTCSELLAVSTLCMRSSSQERLGRVFFDRPLTPFRPLRVAWKDVFLSCVRPPRQSDSRWQGRRAMVARF
jgi:hypothetical protein